MSSNGDMPQFKANNFWREQDFQQSSRLHVQHWITLHTLGYSLDPLINIPKEEPIRIADVACCNGAWMMDLQKERPNATFDGFDLTDTHFPGAGWLPPKMQFHIWDAFTEVPEEFIEAYDIVHIRALYSAVVENKVEPLVDNVLKMVKPGGYIQWEEGDPTKLQGSVPESHPTKAEATNLLCTFLTNAMKAQRGNNAEWVYALPETLKSRGLEILRGDWIPPKKELQRAWNDNFLGLWSGMAYMIPEESLSVNGSPEKMSRARWIELVEESAKECGKGVWINCYHFAVTARKPI